MMNQLGEALAGVNRAIEIDPSLGDAYWIRGAIMQRSGRPRDALEDLQRAIELRPSRYEAYATMGDTYDELGDLGQAIEAYRHAVEHVDDNGKWYYELGSFLHRRGGRADLEEAGRHLQRATLLGDATTPTPPWLADAHRLRGELLQRSGSTEEAIVHFRRFLELAPHSHIDRDDVRRRLMDLGVVPD